MILGRGEGQDLRNTQFLPYPSPLVPTGLLGGDFSCVKIQHSPWLIAEHLSVSQRKTLTRLSLVREA